jgi:hypothetical protein
MEKLTPAIRFKDSKKEKMEGIISSNQFTITNTKHVKWKMEKG